MSGACVTLCRVCHQPVPKGSRWKGYCSAAHSQRAYRRRQLGLPEDTPPARSRYQLRRQAS